MLFFSGNSCKLVVCDALISQYDIIYSGDIGSGDASVAIYIACGKICLITV